MAGRVESGKAGTVSEQKLASSPADEWRIMVCPLGSNTPVRWVRESFYMRELTAATARANALLLALEAARHEAICAAASGRVRLENIDKTLAAARKLGESK